MRGTEREWLELLSYIHALIYHEREGVEHDDLNQAVEDSVATDAYRKEIFQMGKTIAEELMEKGEKRGVTALQRALLTQLNQRFGSKAKQKAEYRVHATTNVDQLQIWLEHLIVANNFDELGIN